MYLEDEEIALIRRGEKLKVVNLKNVECPHEVKTVALNLGQLEKGGYPHFMLKEIFEQPGCIHDCMRGRINVEGTNVVLSAVIDYKERLLAAKRFVIVACGTSWHAALIGKHLIESFCRIPVEVEYGTADGEIPEIFARRLEQTIRKEPAYWLWSHKRWKLKRPEKKNE